ncbi:MAG TPA: hypothetical protein VJ716_00625 [Gaiellaceae bacterium]|nr:hypothetical protein [Gaiellaceae bacterium]
MKAILVLGLLATAGFALAACGSGAQVAGGPVTTAFTSPTTTTIADAQTGDKITCNGTGGAAVPPPGHGVAAIGDPTPGSTGSSLVLKRLADGSLVVSCTL